MPSPHTTSVERGGPRRVPVAVNLLLSNPMASGHPSCAWPASSSSSDWRGAGPDRPTRDHDRGGGDGGDRARGCAGDPGGGRLRAARCRALAAPRHRRRRRGAAGHDADRVVRAARPAPAVAARNPLFHRGDMAMARRPAEIQADIALTRRHIEAQLDHIEQRFTRRGRTLTLVLGGAFVAGLVLSRLPLMRLVRFTAGVARAGATAAGTITALGGMAATVERIRATPRRLRAA